MSEKSTSSRRENEENQHRQTEEEDGARDEDTSNQSSDEMANISAALRDHLHLEQSDDNKVKVIEDLTFKGLMNHWKSVGFQNIITMVGAGISTSAGIPDFRSADGLYNNLEKYNLPCPTAIFDLSFFKENPRPFFALANELIPGCYYPTPAHYFIRLLHEKGVLVRHYSQNIDTLERLAGIPEDVLVEAHGSFYTSHCLGCSELYSMNWMKNKVLSNVLPKCEKCDGVVKPDITFFGENLPARFHEFQELDFKKCDLLIVMGTSLEVEPFASLVDGVKSRCMRLLLNRDNLKSNKQHPLLFGKKNNIRDVAYIGNCDDGIFEIVKALGWNDELLAIMNQENLKLKGIVKLNQNLLKNSIENKDSVNVDNKKKKYRKCKDRK